MVRKEYTEEQIIAVLREGEAGTKVNDLCRKYGMSDAAQAAGTVVFVIGPAYCRDSRSTPKASSDSLPVRSQRKWDSLEFNEYTLPPVTQLATRNQSTKVINAQ